MPRDTSDIAAPKPKQRKPAAASLREQAYRSIKQHILDEHYAPGALLSENQLAEQLQISRTPIREALRDLATGGLVRILPQRGVVVSELSLQDIVEVYQLREQLECFATRLAAERMRPEDAEEFQTDHRRAMECMSRSQLRPAYDASVLMHGRIIAMARNSRLTQFMRQLSDQVHRFGLLTLRHGRAEQALAEHGAIIDAMARRDGEAAEAGMRAHLRADRDMVLRLTLPAILVEDEASGLPGRADPVPA